MYRLLSKVMYRLLSRSERVANVEDVLIYALLSVLYASANEDKFRKFSMSFVWCIIVGCNLMNSRIWCFEDYGYLGNTKLRNVLLGLVWDEVRDLDNDLSKLSHKIIENLALKIVDAFDDAVADEGLDKIIH